jgi:hypothetical protein
MTIIEIRPHRWGWKVFEVPGVEPVFPKKDQAIDYAVGRACFRSGEIRVLDLSGKLERTIARSGPEAVIASDYKPASPLEKVSTSLTRFD